MPFLKRGSELFLFLGCFCDEDKPMRLRFFRGVFVIGHWRMDFSVLKANLLQVWYLEPVYIHIQISCSISGDFRKKNI